MKCSVRDADCAFYQLMADIDVQKFVLDLLEETRLYEDNKKVCEEIL